MSTVPAKKNRTLLYLLVGAIVLKLSWGVLQDLYHTLSYVGLNTLLALDLSAYGQLTGGGWPSFGLLGLGLGAAGGAIAARRRYALAQSVAVGGWVAISLLLLLLYATVDGDSSNGDTSFETAVSSSPAPSTPAAVSAPKAESPPTVLSEPAPVAATPPTDTSSTVADGWQQVVEVKLPLQTRWTDSVASCMVLEQGGVGRMQGCGER